MPNKPKVIYRVVDETEGGDVWTMNDPPSKISRYGLAVIKDGVRTDGHSGPLVGPEFEDYWEAGKLRDMLNQKDFGEYLPPDFRQKYWTANENKPIGGFPMRQDIEILPADEPKDTKLGWTTYIYEGCEVFGDADRTVRLTNYADIYPGREVYLSWNENSAPLTVNANGNLSSGDTIFVLDFNRDDRCCWTNTMVMNMRGLKNLELKK